MQINRWGKSSTRPTVTCRREVEQHLDTLWAAVFEELAPTRSYIIHGPGEYLLPSALPAPGDLAQDTYRTLVDRRNPYATEYRIAAWEILGAAGW